MTSEYWKKRAKDLEQQHFEPAHETQQRTRNNDIPVNNPNEWKDLNTGFNGTFDASAALMQRALQQQQTPFYNQQPQQPQPQQQMVYLKEGQTSFKELQGTNSPVSLAMNIGPISGVVGKQFEIKGRKRVYIVESHNKPVNLAELDQTKIITLVAVSAPFIGTLLVPESAIVGGQNRSQKILKD